LKRYNDRGGAPGWKKGKEVAFLRAYEGVRVIPQILEDRIPEALVLSFTPGVPLSRYGTREGGEATEPALAAPALAAPALTAHHIREISRRTGLAHALLLDHKMPDKLLTAFRDLYRSGLSFKNYALSVLNEGELIASEVAAFADPIFRRSLDFIRSYIDDVAQGSPMLYKEDWRPTKIILSADWDVQFVDFERSYLGTSMTYLGAVVDHLAILDWPSLRRGLEWGIGRSLYQHEIEMIYAMALYDVWLRIVATSHAGHVELFEADRLKERFDRIATSLNVWESI
jgi:hypothetical protein